MTNEIKKYSDYNLPDRSVITAIAELLKSKHTESAYTKPEDKMTNVDFHKVVLIAWGEGLDPLSSQFWYWKSKGALNVMEAYTSLLNWASSKEKYTVGFERIEAGEGGQTGDIFYRCWLTRDSLHEVYLKYFNSAIQALTQANFSGDILERADLFARGKCSVPGEGGMRWDEMTTRDGKFNQYRFSGGWTPERVAQKRALVAAIRNVYGEPMPEERALMQQQAIASTMQSLTILENDPDIPQEKMQYAREVIAAHGDQRVISKQQQDELGLEEAARLARERKDERVAVLRGNGNDPEIDPLEIMYQGQEIEPYPPIPEKPDLDFDDAEERIIETLGQYGYSQEEVVKQCGYLFGKEPRYLTEYEEGLINDLAYRVSLEGTAKGKKKLVARAKSLYQNKQSFEPLEVRNDKEEN